MAQSGGAVPVLRSEPIQPMFVARQRAAKGGAKTPTGHRAADRPQSGGVVPALRGGQMRRNPIKPARNDLKPATHFGFKPAAGKLSGSQSFSSECEPMRSRRRICRSLWPFPLSAGFA